MFKVAIPRLAVRQLARVAFAAILAFGALLVLADVSSAASRKLSGTHSAGEIKAACDANGGVFSTGASSAAGGYMCVGSGGIVDCTTKGKCTGYCTKCASVAKGTGLNGILRPPGSAGTASTAGGTANKNKLPLHNVNQPIVVQHSGGARSGGSKH